MMKRIRFNLTKACLIFKHKETLVKTISCNLTKACQIFTTFTESLYKNMGILPSKFQEFSPVYRRIIRSSITGICSKHFVC